MDAADIQQTHFISNSLGCQTTTEFTRHWPDLVDRLVLQGPTKDNSRQSTLQTLIASVPNDQNESLLMNFIMFQDYWLAGLRRAFMLLSRELVPITSCVWVAVLAQKTPDAVHYVLMFFKEATHTVNYSATEKMSRLYCVICSSKMMTRLVAPGGRSLNR